MTTPTDSARRPRGGTPGTTSSTGSRAARPATQVAGVRLTSPDKVLWPEDAITKRDLARYYEAMAPVMLPYVKSRPLTLRPFMRGIAGPGIYLKNAPKGAPPWLTTFTDVAESTGQPVRFVVAEDARTLVWLAQYNSIEVHAWLSTVEHPDLPDWAVVDIDPHASVAPDQRRPGAVRAALEVRDALEKRGLRSFAKPTGQAGIHVLVPLDPVLPYDDVRAFFERLGEDLTAAHPDLLTTDYGTGERHGRILFDYAQNARGKTTVAPYSVRPKAGAPVAMPVPWDALEAYAHADRDRPQWTMRSVPAWVERHGDALADALRVKQRLPSADCQPPGQDHRNSGPARPQTERAVCPGAEPA